MKNVRVPLNYWVHWLFSLVSPVSFFMIRFHNGRQLENQLAKWATVLKQLQLLLLTYYYSIKNIGLLKTNSNSKTTNNYSNENNDDHYVLVLSINLLVRNVISYMLVKHPDTYQLVFVSIFFQIKILIYLNISKVLMPVKMLVMRPVLKLYIQLEHTIS